MSSDSYKDYLVEQQQAAQVQQRFNDMMPDPEREAADQAQQVENAARDQISDVADRAEAMDDGMVTVLDEARDLGKRIKAGGVTVEEAKKALLDLRKRQGAYDHDLSVLRPRYDAAVATVKDPAARRDELMNKYPGLGR